MTAETAVTARRCLCGEALTWTACCDLPVCPTCHPGPWASATDGSGEIGHIGPCCPGHNMAGYPLHVDLATQLATAIEERDRARATAVALEQQLASVEQLIAPATGMAQLVYGERMFTERQIRAAIDGDPS